MRHRALLLLLLLFVHGCVGQYFGGGMPGGAGGSADREYYDVLGVEPGCTEAELKKAFRKQALRSHPDKGGDPEVFKAVNEAWSVLSDPEKRQAYDAHGKAGVDGSAGGMPGGFPGGFPGGGGGDGFGGGGGGFGGVGMEDILRAFGMQMGGGMGMGGMLQMTVTLEDLYTGVTKRVELPSRGNARGPQVDVPIAAGMSDGQALQLRTEAGVVRLVLRQQRHRRFVRQEDNLATELEISLHEALTGFRRPLTHLDGKRVWLQDSEVSRPGQRKRLRGLGMPRFRGRGKGDLLVQLSVSFPTAPLTGESARLLRQLLPRNVAAGSPKQGELVHRLQALTAEEEEEAEEEAAGGRGGGGRGRGGGGFAGFRM